ncbi:NmrA-like family protein [Penicillium concentricum]|uniref:NmrA-like family protein n=1 Tax=Penicillium concentricum TaxID=293559 RepID=A0A9W9VAR5_9EURO|nr:NmrA-like family protein [Penicillium concentricum]KAJ5375263.1 NmrA-like family protein [Penicillium concentricum]
MTPIRVGIAGITGKFARCVVDHLLKQPDITIKGYCRDASKLPAALLASPRIHITQGQSDDKNALQTFVKGNDVMVCCYLGDHNLMINAQKFLIDACEIEGVGRYVASDYSLDFTKLELGQFPAKDPMKHIQDYLKSKNVQGVHVLIGIFMETFFTTSFNCWNAKEFLLSYWGSGEEIWESTTYDNAAQFVAAVARDPAAVVLGDCKSIQQIATAFENQFYKFYCTNGQAYLTPDVDASKYREIPRLTFDEFFKHHSPESLSTAAWGVGLNISVK